MTPHEERLRDKLRERARAWMGSCNPQALEQLTDIFVDVHEKALRESAPPAAPLHPEGAITVNPVIGNGPFAVPVAGPSEPYCDPVNVHELQELVFRVRAGSTREGISVDAAILLSELLELVTEYAYR